MTLKNKFNNLLVNTSKKHRSIKVLKMISAHNDYDPFDFELFKSYVDRGINMDIQDVIGTPLHNAIFKKHDEAALYLMEHGADVNFKPDKSGKTPLMLATLGNDIETTKALLKHGADPNIQDNDLNAPLHEAVLYGRAEIVTALIMAGADPDLQDQNGKSASYYKKNRNMLNPKTEKAFDTALANKKAADAEIAQKKEENKNKTIRDKISKMGILKKPLFLRKKARFRKNIP